MLYSSYLFIFIFLPIVLLGYFLIGKLKSSLYQRLFLVGASLIFYGYNNVKYIPLIVVSMLVNYALACFIQNYTKKSRGTAKAGLIVGILFNVLLLGYYKYFNFFVENVNYIFNLDFVLRDIFLPLGISFFTFQQLSFLISVYKCEDRVGTIYNYCAFVSFFPQLVAGPIVLYNEIMPQFEDESRRHFNSSNFAQGIYMFCIGLFKKVVIADTVAIFVDNGFGMENLSFAAAWATSLSYTMQIYFDFSGYSDMAVGLGKMFNIDITYNFLSPYQSNSITQFWRRWHITLGRALSSYIYIPLGGNRKGLPRTCINLFLTFLVSGLWHGAAWTFVLWGAFHGLFVVIERIFKKQLDRVPNWLRIGVTFLIVNFLWVLFRAETFAQAAEVYKGMLNFSSIGLGSIADIAMDGIINFPTIIDIAYVGGLLLVLLWVVFRFKNSVKLYETFSFDNKSCFVSVICFITALLFISRGSVFIYFNF